MSDHSTETKRCTKCGETYPCTEEFFYKATSNRNGLTNRCRSCVRKATSQYAKDHPEKHRENSRKWKRKNPEKAYHWDKEHPEQTRIIKLRWSRLHPENKRKWNHEHPESKRAKSRDWKRKHPECSRNSRQCRRSREAQVSTTLTDEQWQSLLISYENRCAYCDKTSLEIGKSFEQDHVIPLCQGGGYTKENIVPACPSCNSKKGGRTPEQAQMVLRKPISPINQP